MRKVRFSESQSKSIEWISFNMVKWEMLETKKVEEVMMETRNNNSINRLMRWKVKQEHLSNKLKYWLLKKRSKEKKTKSWSNSWDNNLLPMKSSARFLRRVSMIRLETRWRKAKPRLLRRETKLLRRTHWHQSWRNWVSKTNKSLMKKLPLMLRMRLWRTWKKDSLQELISFSKD